MGRTRAGYPGLLLVTLMTLGLWTLPVGGADHGDAPLISNDQGADLADVYAFLNPNDNSRLTVIATMRGFIVPGEAENLGFFQSGLVSQINLETNGDARPDFGIAVSFSERTDVNEPQTARVTLRKGRHRIASFTASTTPPCATCGEPPQFVTTTDTRSGVSFFAGMTDDPFFFDVPAELKFRESLSSAAGPDPTVFERARDTFAGFNIMAIAVDVPLSAINADGNSELGVSVEVLEPRPGGPRSRVQLNRFSRLDRVGIPLVNSALIPYNKRNRYNSASTVQDANGRFEDDIVASLRGLNTDPQNIELITQLAVRNGDMLRLDTTRANVGTQGGDNRDAGFPNGRRLADDPIDIIVNVIANQLFVDAAGALGPVDGVNRNDKQFADVFPFLAPPHQPVFRLDE